MGLGDSFEHPQQHKETGDPSTSLRGRLPEIVGIRAIQNSYFLNGKLAKLLNSIEDKRKYYKLKSKEYYLIHIFYKVKLVIDMYTKSYLWPFN